MFYIKCNYLIKNKPICDQLGGYELNKKLNANVINWFQTQKDRTNSNNGTIKGLSFIQMRIEANQNKQIIFIFWLFIWFCWYYLFKKQSWWQILLRDVHLLLEYFLQCHIFISMKLEVLRIYAMRLWYLLKVW